MTMEPTRSTGLRHPSGDPDAHGAGDPGPEIRAIAVRVLREVLLVVVLRVEELGRWRDLRRDVAVAGRAEPLLVDVPRRLRGGQLLLVGHVDRGAVLGPHVVA